MTYDIGLGIADAEHIRTTALTQLLTLQGGMMSLLDEPRSGFHTSFLLEFPVS